MEIEDGRKVDLGITDVELGYVRCPFGVRRLCRELAVQHVLGCLTDFSAEGVVPFATTHQALQSEGAHQCEHGFLRHPPSPPSKDSEDTSVPVGARRIFEGLTNGFFVLGMAVRVTESIPMVVERRFGEVRDRQQECQRKLRLEIIDSLNFRPSFPPASRPAIFPKHATSARSRSFSVRSVSISLFVREIPATDRWPATLLRA